MNRTPAYLRVVVTTRCNYSCSYCHKDALGNKSEAARCLGVFAQAVHNLLKDNSGLLKH